MVRPYVQEFVKRMYEIYEIFVFTASLQEYGEEVIQLLGIQEYVTQGLYRKDCSVYGKSYTKDLARIPRKLKDMIILDNSPVCFILNPENGILIRNFYDDKQDEELLNMIPFLEFLSDVYDVRDIRDYYLQFIREEPIEYNSMCKRKRIWDPTLTYEENMEINLKKVSKRKLSQEIQVQSEEKQKDMLSKFSSDTEDEDQNPNYENQGLQSQENRHNQALQVDQFMGDKQQQELKKSILQQNKSKKYNQNNNEKQKQQDEEQIQLTQQSNDNRDNIGNHEIQSEIQSVRSNEDVDVISDEIDIIPQTKLQQINSMTIRQQPSLNKLSSVESNSMQNLLSNTITQEFKSGSFDLQGEGTPSLSSQQSGNNQQMGEFSLQKQSSQQQQNTQQDVNSIIQEVEEQDEIDNASHTKQKIQNSQIQKKSNVKVNNNNQSEKKQQKIENKSQQKQNQEKFEDQSQDIQNSNLDSLLTIRTQSLSESDQENNNTNNNKQNNNTHRDKKTSSNKSKQYNNNTLQVNDSQNNRKNFFKQQNSISSSMKRTQFSKTQSFNTIYLDNFNRSHCSQSINYQQKDMQGVEKIVSESTKQIIQMQNSQFQVQLQKQQRLADLMQMQNQSMQNPIIQPDNYSQDIKKGVYKHNTGSLTEKDSYNNNFNKEQNRSEKYSKDQQIENWSYFQQFTTKNKFDNQQKDQITQIIDQQQFVNDLEPEKNWRQIFDLNSPKNEEDEVYIQEYQNQLKNKNNVQNKKKNKKQYDFSDIKIMAASKQQQKKNNFNLKDNNNNEENNSRVNEQDIHIDNSFNKKQKTVLENVGGGKIPLQISSIELEQQQQIQH